MNVRLHKSRQNCAVAGINRFTGVARVLFTDRSNPTVTNQQIAAHDGILGIHRHNRTVFDKNGFGHRSNAQIMWGLSNRVKAPRESKEPAGHLSGKEGGLAPATATHQGRCRVCLTALESFSTSSSQDHSR